MLCRLAGNCQNRAFLYWRICKFSKLNYQRKDSQHSGCLKSGALKNGQGMFLKTWRDFENLKKPPSEKPKIKPSEKEAIFKALFNALRYQEYTFQSFGGHNENAELA